MGTRMAPNYAIIFMHYLESNLLTKSTMKPKTWLKFIDDIFMIWPHSIQTLTLSMDMKNSHHPTIKFTYDYHKQEIPFLDTIVYKTEGNKLFTRNYHKPTDNIYISIQPTLETKKNQSLMDC